MNVVFSALRICLSQIQDANSVCLPCDRFPHNGYCGIPVLLKEVEVKREADEEEWTWQMKQAVKY